MSLQPKYPTTENEPAEPTLQTYIEIAFHSFAVSQGSKSLQRIFFEHMHTQFPNWKIPPTMKDALATRLHTPLNRYVLPDNPKGHPLSRSHLHSTRNYSTDSLSPIRRITPFTVQKELQETITMMDAIFNSEKYTPLATLIPHIIKGTIHRDYHYLVECNGRRRVLRPRTNPYTPQTDAFFSYAYYYILQQHTTHVAAYDSIFHQAQEFLLQHPAFLDAELQYKFIQILTLYAQTHPHETVQFPDWILLMPT